MRLASDGLDIASVLPALEGNNPSRGNAVVALASFAGATIADVLCAQALVDAPRMPPDALRAEYGRRSGFPHSAEVMPGGRGFRTACRHRRAGGAAAVEGGERLRTGLRRYGP